MNFNTIFPSVDIPFINAQAEKDLEIHSHLSCENLNDGIFAQLQIDVTPHINLEQVQLFITHNPAFIIPVNIFFLADMQAHEKHSLEAEIYLSEAEVDEIFSTTLTIMVSFINKQSIARVLRHEVEIPLSYAVRAALPQKEGIFKVTLNAASIVELGEVFKGWVTFAEWQLKV
jgi:PTHB1 C-terminus